MQYNFDEIVNRRGTHSIKWDFMDVFIEGGKDLLPLWVADMDFKSPQPVIEAFKRVAEHGIFGYSYYGSDEYINSVINWMKKRFNWQINREWLVYTPGIVPAIAMAIREFSTPGDKVIIQPPVYYPFTQKIISNGRQVLENELILEKGKYFINFKDLEKKASDPLASIFILCSPHNPVGRVWSKDELERIAEICEDNNLLVISDEIWNDLILPPNKHIVYASISKEAEHHSIIATAPSKTFNIAGLHSSNIIIANKKIRERFRYAISDKNSLRLPSPFAIAATIAAYNEGEEWLEQVINYIQKNFEFLEDFIGENMEGVKLIKPEGTYLAWLDFRDVIKDKDELENIVRNKAKLALDEGYIFGKAGEGFERINVATPRRILKEALEKLVIAIKNNQ